MALEALEEVGVLAQLRSRLAAERPTYHAFELRGEYLLYDLWSGTLLSLDQAAYELLSGHERGLDDAEVLQRIRSASPDVALERLVEEITSLIEIGLFQLEALESESERAETLAAHLEHHPAKMMLLVQTSCNLRCSYCYEVQSGFHQKGRAMDLDTARRAVEFLIQRSGERPELEITFFGGEPLMSFGVIQEVVAYCRGRGAELGKRFYFQLTTNAVLLDDPKIEFLVTHEFSVMVSLDGPPELNDLHRVDLRGRGTGERALANARKLVAAQKAAGIRPAVVRATLTRENKDAMALAAFFAEQGFERTSLGAATGRAHEKGPHDLQGEDLGEMQGDLDRSIDAWLEWRAGRGPRPPGSGLRKLLGRLQEALREPRRRAGIGCGVGRNMQAVTADGSIHPCHRYAGEQPYVLGSLAEGLDRERVERYYREILDGFDRHCSSCWARFACGGQCPWYLSRPDGRVGIPDEESCNSIRASLERQLWLLARLTDPIAESPASIASELHSEDFHP